MLLGAKGQKSGTSSLDTKLTTASKIKALTKEIRRWTSFPHLSLLIVQHSLKKRRISSRQAALKFCLPRASSERLFFELADDLPGVVAQQASENEKSPMPKENLFVPDDRMNTFCTQLCNSYTHDPSL